MGVGSTCYYVFKFYSTTSVNYGSSLGMELIDRHGNKYTSSIYWATTSSINISINREINNANTLENIEGFRYFQNESEKAIYIIAKSKSWNSISGQAYINSYSDAFTYEATPRTDSTLWDSGTDITVNNIVTETSLTSALAEYQYGKWEVKTDANECYYDLNSINIERTYYIARTGSSTSNNTPNTYRNWIIKSFQSYGSSTGFVLQQIAIGSNNEICIRKALHSSSATSWGDFSDWTQII